MRLKPALWRQFRQFGTATVAIFLLWTTMSGYTQENHTVTVTVDPASKTYTIPDDYIGLSFETADILPGADGTYKYFRPDNAALISIFKTIGIKNLRIGGNTSDRPSVKVPGEKDIDELFAFAHAANVRVIYTLRMRESTPEQAAPIAKYLMDHYKDDIDCIVVGNEPDVYEKQYPAYHDELQTFLAALTAPGIAPDLKLCGPSTTSDRQRTWSSGMARDFGPSGRIVWITQHSYPGGNGKKSMDVAAVRDHVLSPDFAKAYESLYEDFAPAVLAGGLKYRIEETNSFYNGGAKDVSNTFTASLWGLDYLFWWATRQSQGVNFHSGDNVAAGEQQTPCWYATFWTTPQGYEIHPIAYAMKAFDLASHGALVAAKFDSDQPEMNAYAVQRKDNSLYVTLINKNHGSGAAPVKIKLPLPTGYTHAETISLTAPGDDIGATTDVKLGGSSILGTGAWSGQWQKVKAAHHEVMLTMPPASAVIVRLTTGK